jgi:PPM family protein phosphatase
MVGIRNRKMALTVGAASDKGLRRENNEDAFVVSPLYVNGRGPGVLNGHFLGVFDGVGGGNAGEVAAAMTRDVCTALVVRDARGAHSNSVNADAVLTDALREAHRQVLQHGNSTPGCKDMATTATIALVQSNLVTVAHVGDSRAYLLRDGSLRRLTHDHTIIATLVRHGLEDPSELNNPRANHALGNAVGVDIGREPLEVDLHTEELLAGDVLLLCTDGLHGIVSDRVIAACLEDFMDDTEECCRQLVAAAYARGAHDNVTCIVALSHTTERG